MTFKNNIGLKSVMLIWDATLSQVTSPQFAGTHLYSG